MATTQMKVFLLHVRREGITSHDVPGRMTPVPIYTLGLENVSYPGNTNAINGKISHPRASYITLTPQTLTHHARHTIRAVFK